MERFKEVLKKTTAMLMIAVLIIGIAPVGSLADVEWSEFALTASAEEELAATGQCGENVYWNYDSSTGKLVISGTGPMYDYGFYYDDRYTDGIYGYCTAIFNDGYILDVEVDNGVTSIGDYSFYYCSDLTSITIPDSVTSIGDSAFSDCRSLTNIEIPNSVTSIGDSAFSNCRSLTNMKIPNSVTSIENSTFYFCNRLTSIEIPDSVRSIGDYAFGECYNLKHINISDSVISIGEGAFSETEYYDDENNWENGVLYIGNHLIAASEDISGNYIIKASTKTIADYAFAWCEDLTDIEIPDSVTNIGKGAFNDCGSLTSITVAENNQHYLSDEYGVLFNKDKTTLIQYPVGNDRTEYTIPDGVIIIGDCAFEHCYNLTSIEVSDSVISVENSGIFDCDNLVSIVVGNNNQMYSNDEFGVLYNKNKTTLIRYPHGNNRIEYIIPNSVTNIRDEAFSTCRNLMSIRIPDSVTTIGERAFWGCENLIGIRVPEGVSNINDGTFSYCENLTSIEIPKNIVAIDWLSFLFCSNLTDVYYLGSQEEWEQVDGNGNVPSEAIIHYNTEMPEPHMHTGGTATCVQKAKCEICDGEYGVLFPHIDENDDAFCDFCNIIMNLEYEISNGEVIILWYSDYRTSIDIPSTIEGAVVTEIASYAFEDCTSLTSIRIPDSVTSIGRSAFAYCDSLTDVYYGGSEGDWNEISIGEYNECLTNATIHFAKGSHTHTYTAKTTKAATCTTAGTKTYTCSCGDSYTEEIKATGKHTGGIATCKAKAICTVCGKAYGNLAKHKEVTVAGTPATYTTEGKTEGKKCSVCGTVTVKQDTIAKLTLGKVDGLKAKKVKVAKKSEITLTWNSVGEGVKYEVYQKNGKKWKKIKTTDKTSYTVKKLEADKEYQFRVRAVVDDIKGKYSSTLKVETIPATATLKLKAGKKQLTASWSKVSDISGYEVQYSTSKKMKSAKTVNAKKSAKKTTIKKLKKGKKYFVRVRAYKTVDGKKIYSDWSAVKNVKVK